MILRCGIVRGMRTRRIDNIYANGTVSMVLYFQTIHGLPLLTCIYHPLNSATGSVPPHEHFSHHGFITVRRLGLISVHVSVPRMADGVVVTHDGLTVL